MKISLHALRLVMKELGLSRRVARSKPLLKAPSIKLPTVRATPRSDTEWDWRRTIFCDEASIKVKGATRT